MFRVLKKERIPLFLHKKSNHIFTVWQHIVLLALRQYEGKSYRMFVEWLVEAHHYLRSFLQLLHIFLSLYYASKVYRENQQYISCKINFLLHSTNRYKTCLRRYRFNWIQNSSCFTQYYTDRTKIRSKYIKLSIGADVLQQIISNIRIRRAPIKHDSIDFRPIVVKTSSYILPLSVVIGDKGYDSEDNHVLVRDELKGFSLIPPRYEHVPIWRTHGRYRKQMKHGYSKVLYNHRNKDETIVSVIKRLFGDHLMSRLIRTQNRELSFRCVAYNTHRLTNLTVIIYGFYKAG